MLYFCIMKYQFLAQIYATAITVTPRATSVATKASHSINQQEIMNDIVIFVIFAVIVALIAIITYVFTKSLQQKDRDDKSLDYVMFIVRTPYGNERQIK